MAEIKLKSFAKKYSKLDSNVEKNFPRVFKLGELIAYNSELSKGYAVERKLDTTEEGTTFTYIKLKDLKHKQEYTSKVERMQKDTLGEELLEEIQKYKSLIGEN